MKTRIALLAMTLASAAHAQQRYTLEVLEGPPGLPWHLPRAGMEGDYIAGYACPSAACGGTVAVRWDANGTPTVLGGPRYAWGLNSLGDVVGGNFSGGAPTLWPIAGGIQSLPFLPGTFSGDAEDINDRGDVVGTLAGASPFDVIAAMWIDGEVRTIPGVSFNSQAIAIDNDGRVAGNRSGSAFFFDGASTRSIVAPGLSALMVEGMNNAGQVVGRGAGPWPADPTFTAQHGFVWDQATGQSRRLGFLPGGYFTQPYDINDHGVIVGRCIVDGSPGDRPRGAFIWEDGRMHDLHNLLDDLGDNIFMISANGINEDGVIAVELFVDGVSQQQRRTGVLRPVCVADLDGDGVLTVYDFLAFLNFFDSGDLTADFDRDGALTVFDFLAYQDAFDLGC